MESSAVSGLGALPQSLRLPAAQLRLTQKAGELEAQGALKLIQAVAPMNVPENVGRSLNIIG